MVSGGGALTTLPVECWPMRNLIFSKALDNGPIELDVNQYGEVPHWQVELLKGCMVMSRCTPQSILTIFMSEITNVGGYVEYVVTRSLGISHDYPFFGFHVLFHV